MEHRKTPIHVLCRSEFVLYAPFKQIIPLSTPAPFSMGKDLFAPILLVRIHFYFCSCIPILKSPYKRQAWCSFDNRKRCFTELNALGFNTLFDGVMFLWLFGNIQITNNHEHNSGTSTMLGRSPCPLGTKFGDRRVNPSGTNRRRVHLSL